MFKTPEFGCRMAYCGNYFYVESCDYDPDRLDLVVVKRSANSSNLEPEVTETRVTITREDLLSLIDSLREL